MLKPRVRLLALAALLLLGHCSATNTLVLLDEAEATRESHARFFSALRERGHEMTFALADATDVRLSTHGVNHFDNVVLFAPAAEDFLGTLDAGPVADFVRQGGNLLAAAASSDQGAGGTSWLLHELAVQCGIVLGEDGTHVVVESNESTAASTFKTSQWIQHESGSLLMAGSPSSPIIYRGIALAPVDPTSKRHVTILSAPTVAYSVDASGAKVDPFPQDAFESVETKRKKKKKKRKKKKKKKKKKKNEESTPAEETPPHLVMGVETQRSGARVVFLGSMDMCADAFFEDTSGNEKFCNAVSAWAFKEAGVVRVAEPLRIASLDHQGDLQTRNFRLNDTIMVGVMFDMDAAAVSIASPSAAVVQLELVQAGHIKQTVDMREDPERGKGAYIGALTFREHDAYGVFQLHVAHRRVGFSTVKIIGRVVVVPVLPPQRLDLAVGMFCVLFTALYAFNH